MLSLASGGFTPRPPLGLGPWTLLGDLTFVFNLFFIPTPLNKIDYTPGGGVCHYALWGLIASL